MTTLAVLRRAVEQEFHCIATLRQIVNVLIPGPGDTPLNVIVAVFNVIGRAPARIAYAWYEAAPSADRRPIRVVIHAGTVDSAEAAVQSDRPGRRKDAAGE